MLLRFGGYVLDTGRFQLRGEAGPVHVEPQVYDVLFHLMTNRDRVVTKEELLEEVWGSRFVSESTLTSRIKAARRAIGDDGARQAVIATVRGRGFRFVAEVTAEDDPDPPDPLDATAAPGGPRIRLPTALGPLVGRDAVVAELAGLVGAERLLTVIGPGGVGKTRCACEAAAHAASRLGLDADFVDLTTIASPGQLARAVAEAIGVPVEAADGALSALCETLRAEERLLVLDNAEHVIDAASDVSQMLGAAPGLRVLVTSRERLRLSGERVYVLDPLATEGTSTAQAPAVDLFETAGRRLDPGFVVDEGNRADVEALCRAVDGLPLGIELVAAHVRILPPAAMRQRLGDRLSSLADVAVDVPDRQRTMADAIEWSMRLLAPDERLLLARLSTFHGGADLDAVEAVALPDLHLDAVSAVAALTDKSLLHRRPGADGSPRFTMLNLVRAHASRLHAAGGVDQATRSRHATFHHTFVRDVERRRWDELAGVWAVLLSERFADIEAALEHGFTAGDPLEAAGTVGALYAFWHRDARMSSGARWTRIAFEHIDELSVLDRGLLHEGAGYLAFWRHDTPLAREHWQNATALFGEAGHDRYRALAMVDAAGTWMGHPDPAENALELCQQGVELSRAVGAPPLVAHAVNVLGELARLAGEDDMARAAYEEGLDLVRVLGDQLHQAIFELNLSLLALRAGDLEHARALSRAGLRLAIGLRRQVLAANALIAVAGVETARGAHGHAARMLGAGEAALRSLGASLGPGDRRDHLRSRAQLGAALGDSHLADLVAEGARLSIAAASAEALAAT